MPETAVHKDNRVDAWEYHIRTTGKRTTVHAEVEPTSMQAAAQHQFSRRGHLVASGRPDGIVRSGWTFLETDVRARHFWKTSESATNRTERPAVRSTNAILSSIPWLSSWAVTLILLQPGLFVRPLGVSENALSGGGEEVAQLVVLHAGEPD
jgi:hypothetical protein